MKIENRWTIVVAMAAVALMAGWGCSSAPETGDDDPHAVMGSPPSEGDQHYEFARPDGQRTVERDDEEQLEEVDDTISEAHLAALLRRGPSVVMRHVEVEPVLEDEDFVGFEVVELTEASAKYLGGRLSVGDVVTHINGVRIEKPDDYLNAWKALNDVREIRVNVIRDGEQEVVTWPIVD